jgi:hypothetical protein
MRVFAVFFLLAAGLQSAGIDRLSTPRTQVPSLSPLPEASADAQQRQNALHARRVSRDGDRFRVGTLPVTRDALLAHLQTEGAGMESFDSYRAWDRGIWVGLGVAFAGLFALGSSGGPEAMWAEVGIPLEVLLGWAALSWNERRFDDGIEHYNRVLAARLGLAVAPPVQAQMGEGFDPGIGFLDPRELSYRQGVLNNHWLLGGRSTENSSAQAAISVTLGEAEAERWASTERSRSKTLVRGNVIFGVSVVLLSVGAGLSMDKWGDPPPLGTAAAVGGLIGLPIGWLHILWHQGLEKDVQDIAKRHNDLLH